jgi:hypothetical protein
MNAAARLCLLRALILQIPTLSSLHDPTTLKASLLTAKKARGLSRGEAIAFVAALEARYDNPVFKDRLFTFALLSTNNRSNAFKFNCKSITEGGIGALATVTPILSAANIFSELYDQYGWRQWNS